MNFFSQLKNRLDLIEGDAAFEDMILEEIQQQMLLEASELFRLVNTSKSGRKLAKHLHTNYGVSHNATITPYKHIDKHGRENRAGNLDLKNFKTHYDNIYIFHGENGWAAFKPDLGYLRKMLRLSGLEKTDTQVDLPNVEPRPVPDKDECNDPKAIERKIKSYDPMHDDCLPYTAVFSLINDKGEPTVKMIDTSRGGSYLRKEKAEVKRQTAADAIKDVIGHKKVKVYVLNVRDDPSEINLPPERFSGKAGKQLGKGGPSIQRKKVDVRKHGKMYQDLENVPSEVVYNSVVNKFLPILPKLLSKIENYFDVADITSKKLSIAVNNPKDFAKGEEFKKMIQTSIKGTEKKPNLWISSNDVAKEISDFRKKNPEFNSDDLNVVLNLAAKGNRVVLSNILKDVRKEMSTYFESN